MPGPHRCYSAVTAVSFQFTDTTSSNNLVVSAFSNFPKVLELSPEAKQIKIGDTLLLIDGIRFDKYFKLNQFDTGGANKYGGKRSAIDSLAYRSGLLYPMPTNNSIIFTFKSASSRTTYKANLPWIATYRNTCTAEFESLTKHSKITSMVAAPTLRNAHSKRVDISVHLTAMDFLESFQSKTTTFELKPTSDPIVTYGIFEPESTNLAVIRLASFEPLNSDEDALVSLVRGLLINELSETKGLILDIRDNGGGLAGMANKLPQLFSPNFFKNGGIKALVTPLNAKLFLGGFLGSVWLDAYNSTKPEDKYTPLVPFDTDATCNVYGQAYFKPVGVFTNGRCYSACDFFAANMQDNDIAWIFGEDLETGAGYRYFNISGANVIESNGFFSRYLPEDFPLMPYTAEMPTSHQDLRVAWRQGTRIGENKGKIIEDYGIYSDSMVRPSLDDVIQRNSVSQWKRIAEKLSSIGKRKDINNVYFKTAALSLTDSFISEPLNYTITCSGLKSIAISLEDGPLLHTEVIADPLTRKSVSVIAETSITLPGFYRFKLVGRNSLNSIAASTYRFVRMIPGASNWLNLCHSPITLQIGSAAAGLFNQGTSVSDGWVNRNGSLAIGSTIEYVNNVNSRLSFFANAAKGIKLQVRANYDTEADYDYFGIGYADASGEHELIWKDSVGTGRVLGVSGKGAIDTVFDIPAAGSFEVYIWFKSDGGVTAKGVDLQTLALFAEL